MPKLSRRAFARQAVVAATTAVVLPQVLAQTEPAPPKTTAAQPKPPDNQPTLSAAGQAEVDARINTIFARYGSRLNDEQRADIRRIVTGAQAGLEALRAYPLANGSEPAEPFRTYRGARK